MPEDCHLDHLLRSNDNHMNIYGLRDNPPVAVTLMAALQHILLSVSGCLTISSIVADVACVPFDHPVRSKLFCTTVFMVGLCTILQTAVGVRLPIFQGPSSSFLVPILALRTDPTWKCRAPPEIGNTAAHDFYNVTPTTNVTSTPETEDIYTEIQWRIQEMSGALMIASLFEIVMGASGLLNVLLRYIGPITVACTITLIGISLYKIPVMYGRPSFPMSISCMVLVLIFVLYLQKVGIPLPKLGKSSQRGQRPRFYMFVLIPIILAVMIVWAISWILTLCDIFTDDRTDITFLARADAKANIISNSDWLQVTYPGQFGKPKVSVALILGFLVAILASMVESVGDYYAAQKASEVPAISNHAISRGILVEGIGSFISGSVGAGHATTSYSGNIALLKLTKTSSRVIMYTAGGILIGLSLLGKAGAAICTIPVPILGGVMMVIIGTLISIGLSNLKNVDMTSSRNLLVVGVPIMAGIVGPACLDAYPDLINTGSNEADRLLRIVLGTPMFLGGVLAFILDASAPGTLESRGMADRSGSRRGSRLLGDAPKNDDIYSWTFYPRLVKYCPYLTYLPFMPKKTGDIVVNSTIEDMHVL